MHLMHIKTERLSLRPVSETDAPFLFELMTSDSWIKNIGDRGIKTLDDARSYASNNLIKSYKTNGYGLYVICLEAAPIGLCGLVKRDYLPLPPVSLQRAFYHLVLFSLELCRPALCTAHRSAPLALHLLEFSRSSFQT